MVDQPGQIGDRGPPQSLRAAKRDSFVAPCDADAVAAVVPVAVEYGWTRLVVVICASTTKRIDDHCCVVDRISWLTRMNVSFSFSGER